MNIQNTLKKKVAEAALKHINSYEMTIGIGTGSTVNALIEILSSVKNRINSVVSSSEASTKQLKKLGFHVQELNNSDEVNLYIDGADEVDSHNRLIKGGGGALTREKIIANAANRFICIVDASKKVDILGNFPLPVEVIPMARSYVARALSKLGGQPIYREGMVTDNGNVIIDVHQLKILDPKELETKINQIPGVVTNGLFAHRGADLTLIASEDGIVEQSSFN